MRVLALGAAPGVTLIGIVYFGRLPGGFAGDRFPDPDRLDLDRPVDQRHLTFGHGIHYCMGALLAWIQVREVVSALARRFPALRLPDGVELTETPRLTTRGVEHLPVVRG